MLRAMSRGRGIGQVTSLAVSPTKNKKWLPRQAPPLHIRINSAAFSWLNYRGIKMIEVEGLAPPLWLDVSQLPWLLGDTSKLALVIGLAPTDFPSTEG